jgi:hypothetical protein
MSQTIKALVRDMPCLDQLEVFARADQELSIFQGRYFGGKLTDDEVLVLTPKKPERNKG